MAGSGKHSAPATAREIPTGAWARVSWRAQAAALEWWFQKGIDMRASGIKSVSVLAVALFAALALGACNKKTETPSESAGSPPAYEKSPMPAAGSSEPSR